MRKIRREPIYEKFTARLVRTHSHGYQIIAVVRDADGRETPISSEGILVTSPQGIRRILVGPATRPLSLTVTVCVDQGHHDISLRETCEAILGDLSERYGILLKTKSRGSAQLWLWRQVAESLPLLILAVLKSVSGFRRDAS